MGERRGKGGGSRKVGRNRKASDWCAKAKMRERQAIARGLKPGVDFEKVKCHD